MYEEIIAPNSRRGTLRLREDKDTNRYVPAITRNPLWGSQKVCARMHAHSKGQRLAGEGPAFSCRHYFIASYIILIIQTNQDIETRGLDLCKALTPCLAE